MYLISIYLAQVATFYGPRQTQDKLTVPSTINSKCDKPKQVTTASLKWVSVNRRILICTGHVPTSVTGRSENIVLWGSPTVICFKEENMISQLKYIYIHLYTKHIYKMRNFPKIDRECPTIKNIKGHRLVSHMLVNTALFCFYSFLFCCWTTEMWRVVVSDTFFKSN